MVFRILAAAGALSLAAVAAQATTIVSASSAGAYSNTGPGLTFSDTATFVTTGDTYTSGVFSLTYDGDFHTSSGEIFDLFVDGVALGRLSDGNASNDRFDNGTDQTVHNSAVTISAALTDAEVNSILGDGSVTITFNDITPPGDWIDWVNTFDWSISAEVATPSAVPLPAGLPLLLVGFGALAALRSRKS